MKVLLRLGTFLPALLLLACPSAAPSPAPEPPTPPDLGDDDDSGAGDDDDSAGLLPCDPQLALDPDEAWALPGGGVLAFGASGGTGAHRFAVSAGGGQVHPEYGTFLPGTDPGEAEVLLTDLGCEGEARAAVHVVQPLVVQPTQVEAPPGTGFPLQVSGGSGSWSCALQLDGTGASVTPGCVYAGGPTPGLDLVRVTDEATGETVDVRVELADGAVLEPLPPRIWVPAGGVWELDLAGGSGVVSVTPTSGSGVTWADGWFEATAPGTVTFHVEDTITAQTTSVTVTSVAPLEGGFPRAGDNNILGDALSPGDLNGDGFPDAVLGISEGDVGNYNSGLVHVYAGQPGGLGPTPAQTVSGLDYEDRFGNSVAVADVTGDGEPDLLVGIYLSDVAGGNAGEVQLFPGVPGGFFEPVPSRSWTGSSSGDQFGMAIATCDFNGDGLQDLAVGANVDEDRSVPEIQFSQGSVSLYLGGAQGLPELPQQVLWGAEPSGGSWSYHEEHRFGSALATGDVDGDGLCDLVVGSYEYEPPGENGNDGSVLVFRGTNGGGSSAGLEALPVAAIRAVDPASRDSHFGRAVAVGDVDGDGLDDLLVGQYRDQVGSATRHGSARLFLSPGWDTPVTEWTDADAADAVWSADSSYDAGGWMVTIGDVDGQPPLDVVVSGFADEVDGGASSTGVVRVYAGAAGGPADVPLLEIPGLVGGDFFGARVAVGPDGDGDGLPDLFVYASRAEENGTHVGTPYFVSTGGVGPTPLENPGESSGQRAGNDVALVGDVTGEGWGDLVVGVPEFDESGSRINAGLAQVFLGDGPGSVGAVPFELLGFERYSDSDRWGWKASEAGDFNGDGTADLALLGRYEDRPSSWPSSIAGNPPCGGSLSNSGAVAIFLGGAAATGQPAFLYFGPYAADSMRDLEGGFDYDGDGFDDLAVSGIDWDGPGGTNAGGFELLRGRPANPGGIEVICPDSGRRFEAGEAGARMGRGLAGLGDLDGDGCDEVAVGAYDEDHGYGNQGVVRVLWGYGSGCASGLPEVSVLVPQDTNARSGWALDGGGDVDGDGIGDLLVGGYSRSTVGNSTGAAWLVPGWYLLTLPREPLVTGALPSTSNPMLPPVGGPWTLVGSVQDEHFGRSVAFVPGIGPGGTDGVAIGAARSNLCGVDRTGGVRIHVADASGAGFDPSPWGMVGGESFTPNGRVGEEISGGLLSGVPVLVVGGYRASTWGAAQGAAWLVPLSP